MYSKKQTNQGKANEMADMLPELPWTDRAAVNWRSVLIGLVGTSFIAALVPWNDLLVGNTFLIGGTLPVGLLAAILLLSLLNAPLRRWCAPYALNTGEMAVVTCIILVGCAVPASGFVSYVIGMLAGLKHHAIVQPDLMNMLQTAGLPDWVFPTLTAKGQSEDPVIRFLVDRIPPESGIGIPWSAWLMPALAWVSFGLVFWGALLCMSILVRRQWVENERLPFPVASVLTSLIEEPRRGHAFNDLLCSRSFWIAVTIVVSLRSWNAMAMYFPRNVPPIPLGFNLWGIFSAAPPLSYVDFLFSCSNVYFAVVGLTFFLQSKIAFSLWSFYVMAQIAKMVFGSYSAELTGPMQMDQMFGSMLVMAGLMLWIGRQHWAMILRAMFAARREDDHRGSYLPYWLAGWALVICCLLQVVWLVAAGTTFLGAVVIVMMMLLLLMMVSRVAAETGLYYVQLNVPAWRPWIYALPHRTSAGTFFWSTFMAAAFTHDTRECASVYTIHALRVADDAGVANTHPRRQAVGFIMALMLSLVLAFAVSGASYLKMDYDNAIMLGGHSQTAPNSYAFDNMALNQVADPMRSYLPPREGPVEMHSRAGHLTFGAGLTAVLGVLRLRYEGFPFHPLGFLLAYTFPISRMWFSIFLGWLLKSLVVRYGGASLFKAIRPMFIGLVVGEAMAAALWLVIALGLAWAGQPYFRVYFTP